MLTIESNIDGVIRQTESLLRNIPAAMERALDPKLWEKDARDVAERTLLTLATLATARFVPGFVQTMLLYLTGGGGTGSATLTMRMSAPHTGVPGVGQARSARASIVPGQNSLFLGQVQAFEDLLVEWVATEKHKDKRDYGKSDEDVAGLISYILLTPEPGPKALKARAGLEPYIADFIRRKTATGGVDDKTADEWLRAVLAAWRALVKMKYPGRVREVLESMRGQLI